MVLQDFWKQDKTHLQRLTQAAKPYIAPISPATVYQHDYDNNDIRGIIASLALYSHHTRFIVMDKSNPVYASPGWSKRTITP